MHKQILYALLLISVSMGFANAQQYSLYDAKNSKEGKPVLKGQPYMWFGQAKQGKKSINATGSHDFTGSQKQTCIYAALDALIELKKDATKKKYAIIQDIHSPGARPGFFNCNFSGSSATVKLYGNLSQPGR